MKKRLGRALITSLVMSSLFLTTVMASPEDDVASLESQKSATQAEASSVSDTLVSMLTEYQALEKDIDNQNTKIEQASKDLDAAQEKEKAQYEDMKLRIKYMYEEGDTSFIEALFSAESFADLLAQSEYVDKIYNYDRDKLNEYVETKDEVQNLKNELEGEQAEMEDMAAEMETQTQALQSTLNSLESQISDLDSELEEAKKAAEAELAAQKEAEEAETEEEAEQEEAEAAETEKTDKTSESQKEKSTESSSGSKSGNGSSSKSSSSSGSKSSSGSSSSSSSSSSNKSSGSSSSSSSSSSKPSNASLGQQIADKACEYVGGKYVYGGNSLTSGVDCSGFVQQIHKLFGISTPRSSSEIRYGGKGVSWDDKLPGDVICYSGHVAIYIGNNQICHASNSAPYPQGGIKISSPANYRTVLAVRRYW